MVILTDVPTSVTHLVSMKVSMAVVLKVLAALRERSMIAVVNIVMIVDMAVKLSGTMEPWTRSNKRAAVKPFRPIVPVGGARIRSVVIITIGATGLRADIHRNLRLRSRNTCRRNCQR